MTPLAGTIETLSTEKGVFKTPFINVDHSKVRFPNGVEGEYSVISNGEKKGAVIIPMTARRGIGYFGIVRQYRYPVQDFTLEFPRGGAPDLEEGGAQIEIREELGQEAKRLVRIGTIYPDTGILSTEVGVWLAILDSSVLDNDHLEGITGLRPEWIQEGSLEGMMMNGKITCGMTLAAFMHFKLKRGQFGSLLNGAY